MRIFVLNPNSTGAMTDRIRRSAGAAAAPGTEVVVANPDGTPRSIEGYRDEAVSVPAMLLSIMDAEAEGAKGHVIACFDDPGLHAAREVAAGPVVGICEAGVRVASIIASRFSVVTTLPRAVPIIEDLIEGYGAGRLCRRVRAVDLPVLALEEDAAEAERRLAAEIGQARDVDGAEAVILGCAGMAEMADRMAKAAGIPVIDGVRAGVKLVEGLVGGGFRTAKGGAFGYPREK